MIVIIAALIDTARTVRPTGVAAGTETAVVTDMRADTGMGAAPATAELRRDVKTAMIDHPAGVLVIRAKSLARTRVLMINIGSAVVATYVLPSIHPRPLSCPSTSCPVYTIFERTDRNSRTRSAIGPRIEGSAAIAKGSESGRRVKQRYVHYAQFAVKQESALMSGLQGSRSSNATTSDSWGKYGVITEKE